MLSCTCTPTLHITRWQADAIVLKGGYVLFLVFRGDNTIPVYKTTFSPLHNRCILLLSKLLKDGCEGYWDNLYSSVDVMQEVAKGATYSGAVTAGSHTGTTDTIVVPKTGLCGTARTNRGVPTLFRQPEKKGMSKAACDAIKAKPIEERMKSQMTQSEPRIICASVWDNGPVHMLDSIHTSAGIVTIHKPRWDAATQTKVKVPLRILALVDDYNQNMHYVDIRDHLAHEYNLDGGFWRDRKWWVPIFKELFKSACDQGYVTYKRVCQIENDARLARVSAERAEAARQAEVAARRKGIKDATQIAAVAALAEGKVDAGRPIIALPHLDFLEKIAEGFVIEAYNSTKDSVADMMSLRAYNLQLIERALQEMKGEAPASTGATGQTRADGGTPATAVAGRKRSIQATIESDGRLAEHELQGDVEHALIDASIAVQHGIITEEYRNQSLYCTFKFCPWAAGNKKHKCGEKGAGRQQNGRSRTQLVCMHPRCACGWHATCWSYTHRKCPWIF